MAPALIYALAQIDRDPDDVRRKQAPASRSGRWERAADASVAARPRQAIEPDRRFHFSIRCCALCSDAPRLQEIGDVPKSPVPVLTALVHVSEDKSGMRGIKAGWSPS